MRLFVVILLPMLSIPSIAQRKANLNPQLFDVLFAENARTQSGRILKSLDVLNKEDIVTVGPHGTLSLIHFTGFPVEINSDTTFKVNDLNQLIIPGMKLSKRYKFGYPQSTRVEYLFISRAAEAAKYKLSSSGSCNDCNFDMEVFYPPKLRGSINYSGDLCLRWRATSTSAYQVDIMDAFESQHKIFRLSVNELSIRKEVLSSLSRGGKDIMILTIRDSLSHTTSDPLVIELNLSGFTFPFGCDIKSATAAIAAGLAIELCPRNYEVEAGKYFQLATELSDRPFYQQMLKNYRERRLMGKR